MAQRSDGEILQALKAYGQSQGYGDKWLSRSFNWLTTMRDEDSTNQAYTNSMNKLFGNNSYLRKPPLWEVYNRMKALDWSSPNLDTPTYETNGSSEVASQPQSDVTNYSYTGGNGFWSLLATDFINNLNKTEAGRAALKRYDTNGDNRISEDELRAMQGGQNLTADAKVGSRTLGAFKNLMNEEDYNNSLNTYNSWLNSRKPVNTRLANAAVSTQTTPSGRIPSATNRVNSSQVNSGYNRNIVQGMTAPSYIPDDNGNVTPVSGYGYTPQATSGPTWDPSAPANTQPAPYNSSDESTYLDFLGQELSKDGSPYYQYNGANGYTRRSGEEAETERARQSARNQAYRTVGRMVVNLVVGNTDRAKSTMGKVLSGLEWLRDRWNSEEARRNRNTPIGEYFK